MNQLPQSRDTATGEVVSVDRQLPSGRNNLERITQHTKGLAEDLTTWVELKLKLTQLEIEDKFEKRLNRVVVGVIVGIVGFLALFFGLVTVALGIGEWLGHAAWGFLVITILLAIIAGTLMLLKPNLVQRGEKRVRISDEHVAKNVRVKK